MLRYGLSQAMNGSVRPYAESSPMTAGSVFVSMASLWELRIKANLGKLHLPANLGAGLEESGLALLPITIQHIDALDGMPAHHKDPFDRMLVAQAQVEGMTVVTADRTLGQYDVPVLWS